ncbi:putative oligopeptide transporter [Triangularia verruculosa]|uniref:Oligopeptide transporter n=1 Tax=Triangularia verruculosa TaxID=2587418 RepID=A0AAN7AVK0_9PEZI|nr:putative oligopeptide transporter [Triangularia verruculosa]
MNISPVADEESQNDESPSFTWRAVLAGFAIGLLVNLSNIYYGLRIGAASQMSMVSALLGFISFGFLQRFLRISLSPSENVLLLSVSTATECMPLTAGFINVIPALEHLISSENNGQLQVNAVNLIIWSIGICVFGLVFAAVFRKHFVVREKLPWPGARVAANLINTLHRRNLRPGTGESGAENEAHGQGGDGGAENTDVAHEEQALLTPQPTVEGLRWNRDIHSLFRGFLLSWGLGTITYFVPVLREIPVFGHTASKKWLWSVDLSPGFFGQGVMAGPAVPLHTMMGAVAGWGILGWIIWIALASLLADTSVKLGWLFGREFGFFLGDTEEASNDEEEDTPPLRGRRRLVVNFLMSVLIAAVGMHLTFGSVIPWYYSVLALTLALPMAAVGIRSVAETDHNPECALVSQLAFATLLSSSNPNAIIINLLSAAISQAGATQAGDISYNFRTGQLVGANPTDQLHGHIIGSVFGSFLSCGLYTLYTTQHPIPGPLFRVPAAFLFLNTARLAMRQSLPEGVAPFAIAAAGLSAVSTILKIRHADRWWQTFIPTGVSFAIGIYNTPSFTITRIMGGVYYWAYTRLRQKKGRENDDILVFASGLVVGEPVASLTCLVSAMMLR